MTAKSPAYSGNTGPRRRALLLPIGIRLLAIPAGLYCALPAHHSRAYGTAAFPRPRPGVDHRFPHVALRTDPPDPPAGSRCHRVRGEASVLCRMPLTGQLRTAGGKIALPRHRDFPRTYRAASSAAGPGMYRCLPGVSVLTPPPDFALAAAGNLTWAQGKITLDVPLLQ